MTDEIFELIIGILMLPPVALMYAFLCVSMWKFIVIDFKEIQERKKRKSGENDDS